MAILVTITSETEAAPLTRWGYHFATGCREDLYVLYAEACAKQTDAQWLGLMESKQDQENENLALVRKTLYACLEQDRIEDAQTAEAPEKKKPVEIKIKNSITRKTELQREFYSVITIECNSYATQLNKPKSYHNRNRSASL